MSRADKFNDAIGDEYEELPPVDPWVTASAQTAEASNALDRDPNSFVRWPYPDLAALTGQMAPGNVWFCCGASGGGKTTFVSTTIEEWRKQGRKIYVMPLETRPYEFRTYLACMELGLHPGDVLSGELMRHPDYREIRGELRASFDDQTRKPYLEQVMVSSQQAINLAGLQQGLKEAKAFGAHVVIVDHIDHIEGGEGSNSYAEAKRVTMGALRMAQDNEMLILFTSQLNTSVSKGDYLAKFMPPRRDHVLFGGLKESIATGMIGLFRPLRKKRSGESDDDYGKALKAAKSGLGSVTDVLEPNTMGVVAMKLRNYGSREGMKAYLRVENGRVESIPEKDKWTTASGYPRPAL